MLMKEPETFDYLKQALDETRSALKAEPVFKGDSADRDLKSTRARTSGNLLPAIPLLAEQPEVKKLPYTKSLITVKEAAAILGLSPKTLYNRGAGTEHLTRVRHGRVVRMIRQEVEAHVNNLIKKAERSHVVSRR